MCSLCPLLEGLTFYCVQALLVAVYLPGHPSSISLTFWNLIYDSRPITKCYPLSFTQFPLTQSSLTPGFFSQSKNSSRTFWKTLNLEGKKTCSSSLASGLLCPQNKDIEFTKFCGPNHTDTYKVSYAIIPNICYTLINIIFTILSFFITTLQAECYCPAW